MNLDFLDKHKFLKYQLYFLVGILILLIIGSMAVVMATVSQPNPPQPPAVSQNKIIKKTMARHIDGTAVKKGLENLYPVAVAIDNHFDSWPNYGLSQASLVYETPVEGSTTRFLAFFTPALGNNEISKIGPVRSIRPYFVDIANEYDALLAHAGGSPAGLQKIKELGVPNLEEIAWWGPEYYWRVYSRQAPHNLFTSSNNLAQGVIDWKLGDKIPDYRAWKFNNKINSSKRINKIKIKFSEAKIYNVAYQYSTSTNEYLRFQGGSEHVDGLNNNQIQAANVIVQFVPKAIILDSEGRKKINLIGKGKAWVFRDGKIIKGSWKKIDLNSRTIFYDNDKNEIEFRPGSIWIEIVPGNKRVEIN